MAGVRAHVPLSDHTTLRLGGPARRFAEATTDEHVVAEVRAADERGEPLLVLGGGSNLVVADEGFRGTVVHIATRGLATGGPPARGHTGDGKVTVTAAAGEDWDGLVAWSLSEGLAGLECLSGIPGLTGATPIQNVGAYGQEVSEVITSVRAYDRATGTVTDLPDSGCGFGYRTSAFKREAANAGGVTGRFVVLGVTFGLRRSPRSGPVRYAELARGLGIDVEGTAPLPEVRACVLALRRSKGMVLDPADPDTRSAGSFFTNPVLPQARFDALERNVAQTQGPDARIPRWPAAAGMVKVSAAWLIEHAGFRKGYPGAVAGRADGPRISAKHTLALVNPGGATAASLVALAGEIRDGVWKAFGVELVPEPVLTGGWR